MIIQTAVAVAPTITMWQLIPMVWGALSPGLLMKMPAAWSDAVRTLATIGYHAVGSFIFLLGVGVTPTLTNVSWFFGQTLAYTILSYLGIWKSVGVDKVNEPNEPSEPSEPKTSMAPVTRKVTPARTLSMR